MNTQKESLVTTRVYSDGAAPNNSTANISTPAFFQSIGNNYKPINSVSIDEALAEFCQDPEFVEQLSEANKKLGETLYSGEKSLRALRLREGLTQSQLAIKARTSQAQIAKLEVNQSDFRCSTVTNLASVFGIPADEMFTILMDK